MPGWVQALVVAGVMGVGAVGLSVAVETRRLRHCLATVEPQLRLLSSVFQDWPDAFGVLDEILAQFRTNSGHTLRDVVNRLDRASGVAVTTAERMETLIGHLDSKVSMSAASGLRIEEEQHGVAKGLRTAQRAVDDVAADLLASHQRADATNGPHGEAADAASRSPEEES